MATSSDALSSSSGGAPELSVVIPFFNEAESVHAVLAELRETLERIGARAEVVAINDGSSDATGAELATIARAWPLLRVLEFPRNRGQAVALWEGFCHARGCWIATLDGDGQNPPSELARLWELRESADMIAGARAKRQDSALRRTMSRIANVVRRAALRDGSSDTGCSLKIFRREVVRSFLPVRTMYSFLPAFARWGGWTVREESVAHRPRRAGVSKYGLGVMALRPLVDLIVLCWIRHRTLRRKPPP